MDPTLELEVMGDIASGLKKLGGEADAIRRTLQWAWNAFLPSGTPAPSQNTNIVTGTGSMSLDGVSAQINGTSEPPRTTPSFSSLPDLYSKVSPASDATRALVVGYWFQVMQGEQDLDGFMINKELKHLGHGVTNITTAVTSLIERKPQLVIQTRKSGNSKQARKLYRLTDAGIKAVERLIAGGEV
jgi:hypothetical protein